MNLETSTLPAADAFIVESDLETGLFIIIDAVTGQRVTGRRYEIRKTANRAARQLSEALSLKGLGAMPAVLSEALDYIAEAKRDDAADAVAVALDPDHAEAMEGAQAFLDRIMAEREPDAPATSSPLLADGPVTFSDDVAPVYTPTQEDRDACNLASALADACQSPTYRQLAQECQWSVSGTGDAFDPAKVAAMVATLQNMRACQLADDERIAAEFPTVPTPARAIAPASPIVTREDWLNAASVLIADVLRDRAGLTMPKYRVTCGWPSKGGTGGKKRVVGQCWNPDASEDAHAEVFISPMEVDPVTVVAILAHELIHAGLPKGTGHKGPFVKAAKAIGFIAPFTQLVMTDDLTAWASDVVEALPPYPHARLNPGAEGDKKPQKNRQMLATCEEIFDGDACGYKVRLARKWIVDVGAPICPRCNVQMACDLGDDDGEDVPEGGDE